MAVDSELRATALATTDLLLAAALLAVACYPAAAVGNALLGSPASDGAVNLAVGVVAVGGSYPFVAGDWSYAALESFVLALVAGTLAAAALAGVAVAVLGLDASGSNPAPQALAVAVGYATAVAVRRR